jgi:peptidyl-prolyl cis-trans isomerase D
VVLESIVISPKDVENEFTRKYERAKIQYIAFPPAKFRDQIKPTPEDLKKAFDANRASYSVPEKYSFQALVLDQEKVEKTIEISDAQLRAAYSGSMDNFRMPERVHVRHILIKTEGKSDAEKKVLLAKAQGLLQQLKGGADFAELAKKNSEDSGSAEKGGDLDWLVRGQTVPEFEKVAFALKPKEISDIVTSPYGYHIIQLLEKEAPHVKPFEEVKAGLLDELRKQSVTEKMQGSADQIRAALLKAPATAAEVAKQYGAELITVPNAKSSDPIPGLGSAPEIDQILPGLQPNAVSDVLTLPANRLVVVVMNSRTPPRSAEFNEVESQVRDKVIGDKALEMANAQAKQAAERLKKGEDINQVAKSLKMDVTTTNPFGRSDAVDGLGSAVYVEDAFTKPVGSILGPTMIQGRDVVSKVLEHTPADMAAFGAERETLLLNLKKAKATDRDSMMMDSILSKLTADGKVKVNRTEIQRLMAQYRQK